jgi:potassium-transporting ATPase potassium-binding subunit
MNEAFQLIIFLVLLVILSPLLGKYMAKVFMGEKHIMKPVFGWLETLIYKASGVKSEEEMNWKTYIYGVLLFNLFGFVLLFLLQIFQSYLLLNTEKLPNVSWHLAFNTAMSFTTNTNWQSYSGENTLSYLVQMLGLTVQNFVSAATGIAIVLA